MSNDKYELLPLDPTTGLHRIRALRDIPERGVRAGDLGGWVAGESNLAVSGDAWVSGGAQVYGSAQVSGGARVSGNARVSDDARVSGSAWVSGDAWVSGGAQVYGSAQVSGGARVSGNAWVSDDAQVYGSARVSGDARVSDGARVYGGARVSGDAWVYGGARVSGGARVTHPEHVLGIAANPTPNADNATLTRQKDGGHQIHMGCWTGTTTDLRALAHAEEWPSGGDEEYRDRYRPTLLAIADLFDARIALWEPQTTGEASPVAGNQGGAA